MRRIVVVLTIAMSDVRSLLALAILLVAAAASSAYAISIESLQGAAISVDTVTENHVRLRGREAYAQVRWHISVRIGEGGTVRTSAQRKVFHQGREVGQLNRSYSGRIGVPGERSDGHALWLLDGDKLTMLRTFDVGGLKLEIGLKPDGRSCSARAPLMHETGAGNARMDSAVIKGAKVEVLGSRHVSTTCSIDRALP